ncbi:MAG: sodium:solute symporter, partial [Verrucomicrobiota bacterium]
GLFAAVMIAMAISTDDTNLHSWSSIFVQDVIMPFRKEPLSQKKHLFLLRAIVIATAMFAFVFGLIFPLKDYLMMYMTVTGSVYIGGAGVAIIGGLYWKRGSTAGAWAGMLTGLLLSLLGIFAQNIFWPYILPGLKESHPDFGWLVNLPDTFPVNGMIMSALFALIAIGVYVVVSLLSRQPVFNLERMLHRGKYAVEGDHVESGEPVRGLRKLFNFGSSEFTRGDKVIAGFTVGYNLFWMVVFIMGTAIAVTMGISDEAWAKWWYFKVGIGIILGFVTVFWLLFGGIRDLREMFRLLKTSKRDEHDDGTVVNGRN